MSKNNTKISLCFKQKSKARQVYNMRPFVKLTKKQYRSSGRHKYVYALEYKKKVYRQNIINNLSSHSFKIHQAVEKCSLIQQGFKRKYSGSLRKDSATLRKTKHNSLVKYKKFYYKKKHYVRFSYVIPFSSIASYTAFLDGSSLWAIQKQTTALKVFPQSSATMLYGLNMLEQKFLTISSICKKHINKKKKLWTAGFVRIRKLRQYYGRQLQNVQKLFYWYSYPSYKKINSIITKVYNKGQNCPNSKHIIWSIICLLDTLWSNLIIKSNVVYNSSASCNQIKHKKVYINGITIQKNSFSKPGDIFYT